MSRPSASSPTRGRRIATTVRFVLWLVVAVHLGASVARATNGTWNGMGGANTNWINKTNWVSGIIANGMDSTVSFGTASGYGVRLTTAITNGFVSLNAPTGYSFYTSGAGAWKFRTTTGNAQLNVLGGTNAFNFIPTLVSTGLVIDVAAGARLNAQAINGANASWRTVTKNGVGTLVLTSSSTTLFADWLLNEGILQLDSINGLGNTNSDLTFNGGTLRLGASLDPQYARTLTVGAAGGKVTYNSTNFTLSINDGNQLTGTGQLELAGTVPQQKLLISTNQATFTGTLHVTGGQLQLTHSNALGTGVGKLWLSTNGSATINSFSNRLAISNLTFTGGALSNLSTTAGLAIRGTYSDTVNSTLALNGNVSLPYGPGGLSFENNQANNVYAKVVPYSASADPVIRATGASTTVDFHNRIDVNGGTSADFALVVNNGASMTFKSDASINTMINPSTARPFWLRSDASGTLRLETGTYTSVNPTTIRLLQGYTRLNAIWADASASPTLDVQSGATLGGTGKANAVTSTGGIIQPGIGLTPGTYAQFSTKSLTLDAASTVSLRLGGTGASQFDSLKATTGGMSLANANLSITLDPGFTASVSSTLRIADLTSGAIAGTFNGLPQGSQFNVGAYTFSISYLGGTGNDAVLTTVVPEAKHVAIASAAGLGLWTILRRRRTGASHGFRKRREIKIKSKIRIKRPAS